MLSLRIPFLLQLCFDACLSVTHALFAASAPLAGLDFAFVIQCIFMAFSRLNIQWHVRESSFQNDASQYIVSSRMAADNFAQLFPVRNIDEHASFLMAFFAQQLNKGNRCNIVASAVVVPKV